MRVLPLLCCPCSDTTHNRPTVTAKKKVKRPLTAFEEASADAEAQAVADAARASIGPAARGGAYAAAAGAIIALGAAGATGPDGLSLPQLAIGTLTVSALGFQIWLQAQGGLGGGGKGGGDGGGRR
jgi:hypothetical protein